MHEARLGRWSFLACDPFFSFCSKGTRLEITRGGRTERSEGDPFVALARLLDEYHMVRPPEAPPLLCGAVGYFGYDLGRFVERIPEQTLDDVPIADARLGFYGAVLAIDHFHTCAWICAVGALGSRPQGRVRDLAEARTEKLSALLRAPCAGEARPVGPSIRIHAHLQLHSRGLPRSHSSRERVHRRG